MNTEQFEALVRQTEQFAASHPRLYLWQLGGLAILGIAYVLVIASVSVGILASLLVLTVWFHNLLVIKLLIKGGFVLVLLLGAILKSLWHILTAKLDAPEGRALTRAEVPALFEVLDQLTSRLKTPPIHQVVLTDEFNAAITQIPRLSLFLGFRNHLILGLPLMMGLSQKEFLAVIGHELGHLSGQHSRFSAWIYSVSKLWQYLGESLSSGNFVLSWFYNWYIPYFEAYSFTLRRQHEYLADQTAAALCGHEAIAAALIHLKVKGGILNDKFWSWVGEQTKTSAEPPSEIFDDMEQLFKSGLSQEEAGSYLAKGLKLQTVYHDSHPALKDRLKALRVDPYFLNWNQAHSDSAAEVFLAGRLANFKKELNQRWYADRKEFWQSRYQIDQNIAKEIEQCQALMIEGKLDLEGQMKFAILKANYGKPQSALIVLNSILQHQPSYSPACFMKGAMILEQDQEEGIALIEAVMSRDEDYVLSGCHEICEYLYRHGRVDEQMPYIKRAETLQEKYKKRHLEAQELSHKVDLLPHALSAPQVEVLAAQLSEIPSVEKVYLVRKVLKCDPNDPVYLFGVFRHKGWFGGGSTEHDQKLLDMIIDKVDLPRDSFLACYTGDTKKLFQKMEEVEGHLI